MGKIKSSKFDPNQVKRLAQRYNYTEITLKPREASYMLSFEHQNMRGCGGTESNSGHVRIDVYFTTGKVTTSLNHHKAGKGQMFRPIQDIAMLEKIFHYPRHHSNAGYKVKPETRDKRRQEGLDKREIFRLARQNKCAELSLPPQEISTKLAFSHPEADLIQVWFTTGTVKVTLKKNDRLSEEINKKVDLQKLKEILSDPRKFVTKSGTKTAQKENIVGQLLSTAGQNQSLKDALKEIRKNTANIIARGDI